MSPELLSRLFGAIDTGKAEEVTVECNPDDVTPQLAQALAGLHVDRVSMGAQTFDDSRLRFIRRRHNAAEVGRAVDTLRRAGIGNISIDLIYGLPRRDARAVGGRHRTCAGLEPDHISAYCLSFEEGTPLYSMLRRGLVAEADEETCRQMYDDLACRMEAAGYEHYEISNFALPGRRSRHNGNYWREVPYMGIGAAAHSYDGAAGNGTWPTSTSTSRPSGMAWCLWKGRCSTKGRDTTTG